MRARNMTSYSGIPASEQRFFSQTGWPRDMRGELILEVGSGSGRFTEQAAKTGATVVSLDYSYAVDANHASNGARDNVLIVQADVFAMPFRPQTFDRLFCFSACCSIRQAHREPSPHCRDSENRAACFARISTASILRHRFADEVLGAPLYAPDEPGSLVRAGTALGGFHVAASERDSSTTQGARHQLAAVGGRLQPSRIERADPQGMVVSRYVRHACAALRSAGDEEDIPALGRAGKSRGYRCAPRSPWRGDAARVPRPSQRGVNARRNSSRGTSARANPFASRCRGCSPLTTRTSARYRRAGQEHRRQAQQRRRRRHRRAAAP